MIGLLLANLLLFDLIPSKNIIIFILTVYRTIGYIYLRTNIFK